MVSVVPSGDLQPQEGSGHECRRMYSRGRVEEGVEEVNSRRGKEVYPKSSREGFVDAMQQQVWGCQGLLL